mgnify:FL=1
MGGEVAISTPFFEREGTMNIFGKLDEEVINDLKEYQNRFDKGIKKLNSSEKEHLLKFMYQSRHNLLMDLSSEKNKNFLLMAVFSILILYKLFNCFV